MGKDISVVFQYPMGMGTGMGTIFENRYGYGYGSTRPVPASLPFLVTIHTMLKPTKLVLVFSFSNFFGVFSTQIEI